MEPFTAAESKCVDVTMQPVMDVDGAWLGGEVGCNRYVIGPRCRENPTRTTRSRACSVNYGSVGAAPALSSLSGVSLSGWLSPNPASADSRAASRSVAITSSGLCM